MSILMRFLGNIEAKTDAKGRAFLPAQFRKVLAASGEGLLCFVGMFLRSCSCSTRSVSGMV